MIKKELQLTKREIAAVKASIAHWKRDILAPLQEGAKIIGDPYSFDLFWQGICSTKGKVKCTQSHCALCKMIARQSLYCDECPYYKRHGFSCDNWDQGHWRKFMDNPNLRTCKAMIRALENILPKESEQ